eukprot:NODE_3472_length_970_cov_324.335505_g3187_i0.p1 GENE.NODE_3472_length_970_cov_324.335505_g3187_i0~~NODE_3472_length_970_cov_324.335505_g3187_i0.p1  ORF type:complete len:245 (+),score=19.59 NODE_3472_length_970_cov_324.335505_g3187_i0:72-806(+)
MVKEFTERHRFPPMRSTERRPFKRRSARKEKEFESDPHRLAQRQKQIMYGENTSGYANFIKSLEKDPSLLKGCLPVKPSMIQKCSKRSWDGQIRKWRRALHMYDFVDFGESPEQSQLVWDALIEQNKNPIFASPVKQPCPEGDERKVAYSIDDLLGLAESPLVTDFVALPENLHWLDKRVDLEDDVEDEICSILTPNSSRFSSYSPGYISSPNPNAFYPATPVRLFSEHGSRHTTPGERKGLRV